jgi:hypothetical protein
MIKIYDEKAFDKSVIECIKNDEDVWDFPLDELGYLLREHKHESFILIGDRLYEFGGVD